MARMSVSLIETLSTDVRQVFRQIRKKPSFAGFLVLVLAAGFAVSTAMFSTIQTVLLTPLPFRSPERLVQIVSRWPKTGDQNGWSAPLRDAAGWKTSVPAFEDVAAYRYGLVNLTEGSPEALYGLRVSANLLPMLGVGPQLGQWPSAEEDRPGHTHVVLLSDDLWRRRFHSDPHIVGKVVHFDSEGYQVLGVMPRGFNFPLKSGGNVQLPTDQMQFWVPLGADFAREPHGAPNAGVIARVKEGISLRMAQAQLEAACRLLQQEFPSTNQGLSASLSSLHQHTVGAFDGPLFALLAATGLILMLTCANIASLLLAQGAFRSHELAVRMALGGSAGRVARIPLIEGIVLCCGGCLLGAPLAIVVLKLLIYLAPVNVPRLADTRINLHAVLFELLLTLVCGVAIGGLNALQVWKRSPREVLSETSRTSPGQQRARLRNVLVVGQIALAVVLVSGAGLMLRTFINLLSTDIGYQPNHVLYAITVLPPSRYPKRVDVAIFYKKVLDQLRASPGIESAGVSTALPLVGEYNGAKLQTKGMAGDETSPGVVAVNEVSPGFLETMGVRIIDGRAIRETDTADAPKVAVVDQGIAARLWPHQDPLGKMINTEDPASPVWREVVGVVAPARNRSLDNAPRPSMYLPLSQGSSGISFLVVKSSASPAETTRLLKNVVAAVDPNQSVFFAQTVTQLIQDSIATRRLLFQVMMFFAAAALLLSALGIYALVSFLAASRVREVGIRMALGATRERIARLVVFQGMRLVLIGATAGCIGSALLGRFMSGLLFGVSPFDMGTLLSAVLGLAAVNILAVLIPAYRSARLDPIQALRAE